MIKEVIIINVCTGQVSGTIKIISCLCFYSFYLIDLCLGSGDRQVVFRKNHDNYMKSKYLNTSTPYIPLLPLSVL